MCLGTFEALNFEGKQKWEQKFGFVLFPVTQNKSVERTFLQAERKELGGV